MGAETRRSHPECNVLRLGFAVHLDTFHFSLFTFQPLPFAALREIFLLGFLKVKPGGDLDAMK
jgi:hypothetical protein